ncbi:MAG: GNAT family N-acetyltransferase, partial [Candidatus Omnitrophota bacterium]
MYDKETNTGKVDMVIAAKVAIARMLRVLNAKGILSLSTGPSVIYHDYIDFSVYAKAGRYINGYEHRRLFEGYERKRLFADDKSSSPLEKILKDVPSNFVDGLLIGAMKNLKGIFVIRERVYDQEDFLHLILKVDTDNFSEELAGWNNFSLKGDKLIVGSNRDKNEIEVKKLRYGGLGSFLIYCMLRRAMENSVKKYFIFSPRTPLFSRFGINQEKVGKKTGYYLYTDSLEREQIEQALVTTGYGERKLNFEFIYKEKESSSPVVYPHRGRAVSLSKDTIQCITELLLEELRVVPLKSAEERQAYRYNGDFFTRRAWGVIDNGKSRALFIRIGYLFFLDSSAYSRLSPALKEILGPNVILLRKLWLNEIAKFPFSWYNAPAIIDIMREGVVTDKVILDMGAGYGIVSLTALKLGASFVHLVDSYWPALLVANGQLELNGKVRGFDFRLHQGDITQKAFIREQAEIIRDRIRNTPEGIIVISNIGVWPEVYTATNAHSINSIRYLPEATRFIGAGYTHTPSLNFKQTRHDYAFIRRLGFEVEPDPVRVGRTELIAAWSAKRTSSPVNKKSAAVPSWLNSLSSELERISAKYYPYVFDGSDPLKAKEYFNKITNDFLKELLAVVNGKQLLNLSWDYEHPVRSIRWLELALKDKLNNSFDAIISLCDADWVKVKGLKVPAGYRGRVDLGVFFEEEGLHIIATDNGPGYGNAADTCWKLSKDIYFGKRGGGIASIRDIARGTIMPQAGINREVIKVIQFNLSVVGELENRLIQSVYMEDRKEGDNLKFNLQETREISEASSGSEKFKFISKELEFSLNDARQVTVSELIIPREFLQPMRMAKELTVKYGIMPKGSASSSPVEIEQALTVLYGEERLEYFRKIKNAIPPVASVLFYPGFGSDVILPLYLFDPAVILATDELPFSEEGSNGSRWIEEYERYKEEYMYDKLFYGFSKTELLEVIRFLGAPIIWELELLGVKREDVNIDAYNNNIARVSFPWHSNDKGDSLYEIRFFGGMDLNNVDRYPGFLKESMKKADSFMQKALWSVKNKSPDMPEPSALNYIVSNLNGPKSTVLSDRRLGLDFDCWQEAYYSDVQFGHYNGVERGGFIYRRKAPFILPAENIASSPAEQNVSAPYVYSMSAINQNYRYTFDNSVYTIALSFRIPPSQILLALPFRMRMNWRKGEEQYMKIERVLGQFNCSSLEELLERASEIRIKATSEGWKETQKLLMSLFLFLPKEERESRLDFVPEFDCNELFILNRSAASLPNSVRTLGNFQTTDPFSHTEDDFTYLVKVLQPEGLLSNSAIEINALIIFCDNYFTEVLHSLTRKNENKKKMLKYARDRGLPIVLIPSHLCDDPRLYEYTKQAEEYIEGYTYLREGLLIPSSSPVRLQGKNQALEDKWSRIWQVIRLPQSEFMTRLLNESSFKKSERVLSLGCGRREDEFILARDIGCFVIATDLSPVCINRISKEAVKQGISQRLVARIQDLSEPFSFSNEAFDTVFANCSLISFNDNKMMNIVGEIWRVLKRGGKVFTLVYSKADNKYGKGFPLHKDLFNIKEMPYRFFDFESLEKTFRDFNNIEIRNAKVRSLNGETRRMLELRARKPAFGNLASSPIIRDLKIREAIRNFVDNVPAEALRIYLINISIAKKKLRAIQRKFGNDFQEMLKEVSGIKISAGSSYDVYHSYFIRLIRENVFATNSFSRLKAICMMMPEPAIITEKNMTISLVNTEFEQLSGYSSKEIEGKKKWMEFVLQQDRPAMDEYFLNQEKSLNKLPEFYFRFINEGGDIKAIHAASVVVKANKGRAIFLRIGSIKSSSPLKILFIDYEGTLVYNLKPRSEVERLYRFQLESGERIFVPFDGAVAFLKELRKQKIEVICVYGSTGAFIYKAVEENLSGLRPVDHVKGESKKKAIEMILNRKGIPAGQAAFIDNLASEIRQAAEIPGLTVLGFSAGSESAAKELIAAGASGIISNYYDNGKAALRLLGIISKELASSPLSGLTNEIVLFPESLKISGRLGEKEVMKGSSPVRNYDKAWERPMVGRRGSIVEEAFALRVAVQSHAQELLGILNDNYIPINGALTYGIPKVEEATKDKPAKWFKMAMQLGIELIRDEGILPCPVLALGVPPAVNSSEGCINKYADNLKRLKSLVMEINKSTREEMLRKFASTWERPSSKAVERVLRKEVYQRITKALSSSSSPVKPYPYRGMDSGIKELAECLARFSRAPPAEFKFYYTPDRKPAHNNVVLLISPEISSSPVEAYLAKRLSSYGYNDYLRRKGYVYLDERRRRVNFHGENYPREAETYFYRSGRVIVIDNYYFHLFNLARFAEQGLVAIGVDMLNMLQEGYAYDCRSFQQWTVGCLLAMQDLEIKDKIVVDAGSGDGVITFAALALGAKKIYALDMYEGSQKVILKSLGINGFPQERINFKYLGYLFSELKKKAPFDGKVDILVANLTQFGIPGLAGDYDNCLKNDDLADLTNFFRPETVIISGNGNIGYLKQYLSKKKFAYRVERELYFENEFIGGVLREASSSPAVWSMETAAGRLRILDNYLLESLIPGMGLNYRKKLVIADIGCGRGATTSIELNSYAKKIYNSVRVEVIALDSNKDAFEDVLCSDFEGISFREADFRSKYYSGLKVDIVRCINVIRWLNPYDFIENIAALARPLTEGGILIVGNNDIDDYRILMAFVYQKKNSGLLKRQILFGFVGERLDERFLEVIKGFPQGDGDILSFRKDIPEARSDFKNGYVFSFERGLGQLGYGIVNKDGYRLTVKDFNPPRVGAIPVLNTSSSPAGTVGEKNASSTIDVLSGSQATDMLRQWTEAILKLEEYIPKDSRWKNTAEVIAALDKGYNEWFVAMEGGQFRGYALYNRKIGDLFRLIVIPRKKGYGSKLLSNILESLSESGIESFWIVPINKKSKRFYEKYFKKNFNWKMQEQSGDRPALEVFWMYREKGQPTAGSAVSSERSSSPAAQNSALMPMKSFFVNAGVWSELPDYFTEIITRSISWAEGDIYPYGIRGRRTAVFPLKRPVECSNGKIIRALEIKGILFKEGDSVSHPLKELYRVFKVPELDVQGQIILRDSADLKGGLAYKSSVNEYRILNELNGRVDNDYAYPVGYGQYRDYRNEDTAFGFFIRGVSQYPGERIWDLLRRKHGSNLYNSISLWREYSGLLEKYGLALRDFHDAGFFHNYPHLENISWNRERQRIIFHDFETCLNIKDETRERKASYRLMDLFSAYAHFLNFAFGKHENFYDLCSLDSRLNARQNPFIPFFKGYFNSAEVDLDSLSLQVIDGFFSAMIEPVTEIDNEVIRMLLDSEVPGQDTGSSLSSTASSPLNNLLQKTISVMCRGSELGGELFRFIEEIRRQALILLFAGSDMREDNALIDYKCRKHDNYDSLYSEIKPFIRFISVTPLYSNILCFLACTLENLNWHVRDGLALVVVYFTKDMWIISVNDNGRGFCDRKGRPVKTDKVIKWKKSLGKNGREGKGLTVAAGREADLTVISQPYESSIIAKVPFILHPRCHSVFKIENDRRRGTSITGYFYRGLLTPDKEKWKEETIGRLEADLKQGIYSPIISSSPVMGSPRILVAEDDNDIAEMLVHFLSKINGAVVDRAGDGITALEKLRRQDFDILVTDLNMPGMDGYQLAREAKQLKSSLIILMQTDTDRVLHPQNSLDEARVHEIKQYVEVITSKDISNIVKAARSLWEKNCLKTGSSPVKNDPNQQLYRKAIFYLRFRNVTGASRAALELAHKDPKLAYDFYLKFIRLNEPGVLEEVHKGALRLLVAYDVLGNELFKELARARNRSSSPLNAKETVEKLNTAALASDKKYVAFMILLSDAEPAFVITGGYHSGYGTASETLSLVRGVFQHKSLRLDVPLSEFEFLRRILGLTTRYELTIEQIKNFNFVLIQEYIKIIRFFAGYINLDSRLIIVMDEPFEQSGKFISNLLGLSGVFSIRQFIEAVETWRTLLKDSLAPGSSSSPVKAGRPDEDKIIPLFFPYHQEPQKAIPDNGLNLGFKITSTIPHPYTETYIMTEYTGCGSLPVGALVRTYGSVASSPLYNKNFKSTQANFTLGKAYSLLRECKFSGDYDLVYSRVLLQEILNYPIEKIMVVGMGLRYLPLLSAMVDKQVVFVNKDIARLNIVRDDAHTINALLKGSREKLRIEFIQGEIGSLDIKVNNLEPESFDLITFVDLIGGIPQGNPGDWLLKAKVLLKPEGYLVIDEDKAREGLSSLIDYFSDIFPEYEQLAGGAYLKGAWNGERSKNRFLKIKSSGLLSVTSIVSSSRSSSPV